MDDIAFSFGAAARLRRTRLSPRLRRGRLLSIAPIQRVCNTGGRMNRDDTNVDMETAAVHCSLAGRSCDRSG